MPAIEGISRVDAAPNGYLNFYLDRATFLRARLAGDLPAAVDPGGKVIVEHTAINPNKAAHIGHLRNSALGDTLVRALRFQGRPVEVQNYIDDTGVQVADVVVGFVELEQRTLADVKALADNGRPFDPFSIPEPDTTLSVEDREIGGQGIHLVRRMVDELRCDRRSDRNIVTLTKRLGGGPPANHSERDT